MLFVVICGILGITISGFCLYKIKDIERQKKMVYKFYAEERHKLNANSVEDLDDIDDLDLYLGMPPIEIHELDDEQDIYVKFAWVGFVFLGLFLYVMYGLIFGHGR